MLTPKTVCKLLDRCHLHHQSTGTCHHHPSPPRAAAA